MNEGFFVVEVVVVIGVDVVDSPIVVVICGIVFVVSVEYKGVRKVMPKVDIEPVVV